MGGVCRSSAKSTLTHKSPALRGFFGRAKDYGILIVSCSHSSPDLYKETFFARDLFDCPRPARSHNTLLVGPEKMKLICKGTTLQHQEWMPEIILFIVHLRLVSVHSQSFYCLINQEPSRQICQLWSNIVRGSIRTQSDLLCPMIPISKT